MKPLHVHIHVAKKAPAKPQQQPAKQADALPRALHTAPKPCACGSKH